MTKEELEAIIQDLNQKVVVLDPDPLLAGPKALMDKIAACANYKNEVTVLRANTLRSKHHLSQQVIAARALYQMELDQLTTNDVDIKNLPSISDRQAAARIRLRPKAEAIEAIEADHADMDVLLEIVTMRYKGLVDTMQALKSQKALVHDDIKTLGNGWAGSSGSGSADTGAIPRGELSNVPIQEKRKDDLILEPPADYLV